MLKRKSPAEYRASLVRFTAANTYRGSTIVNSGATLKCNNPDALDNGGPLSKIDWPQLGKINLVLGDNGAGKTFLLKSLYSAMRTLEEFKRGNNPRTVSGILWDKLHWTSQADKIGDLVTKGSKSNLSFKCWVDHKEFSYGFGKETSKQLVADGNEWRCADLREGMPDSLTRSPSIKFNQAR
jgi:autotransporter-associated beta strand protein